MHKKFVGVFVGVVALLAAVVAMENNLQVAFMAPTEGLAEQHAAGIRALLDGVEVPDDGTSLFGARPVRVELLTNRVAAADRRRILTGLAAGEVDVAGLVEPGVRDGPLGAADPLRHGRLRHEVGLRDLPRRQAADGAQPHARAKSKFAEQYGGDNHDTEQRHGITTAAHTSH